MSNTQVTIRNADLIDFKDAGYMELLQACLERCQQYNTVSKCELILGDRVKQGSGYSPVGWLEFGIALAFADGGTLYVGALQRAEGERFEFHT